MQSRRRIMVNMRVAQEPECNGRLRMADIVSDCELRCRRESVLTDTRRMGKCHSREIAGDAESHSKASATAGGLQVR